jgi:SAM-dependent methyltransferase
MKGVTDYAGLSRYYFRTVLRQIIDIGGLRRPGIAILDYGCGKGELKRLLRGYKVTGYDVIPALSDVADWRSVDFDVLVANEVFYSFSEDQLEELLSDLKEKNPSLELVVGISRQGVLNHVGKYLFGRPDAHAATRIGPRRELEILLRHCRINRRRCVFWLADIYSLSFKPA